MAETDLVRTLKALQAEQGWSDERMAKELHVSQSMWTLVRQDKRRPGGKLLAGVDARFPELRPLIPLFLRQSRTIVTIAGQPAVEVPA
jgi:transcriptional regulator with XRE-family HTH domain